MIALVLAAALAHASADTAAPSDNDRDGYAEDDDCNDGEARMNPGEREDCEDGLDNDCDGYTDELDADCLPEDSGCATAPGTLGVVATLAGLVLVSARRRRAQP